jgi:autotransporter adhesin
VGTNSATSTVIGKRSSSKLAGATTGVIGQTGITTATPVTDIVTGTTATESVAATTLTNGVGKTNGLQVFEDRTNLTGGGDTAGAPSSSISLSSTGTTILGGGATGTLASNGSTGSTATNPGASVGSGGISVLSTPATVAPNTTIGDRLNGVTYQDKINGNTLVDGNLYVNGDTKFVGNTAATSTVVGGAGTSKFDPAATVSGQTGIQTSTATNPVPVTDIATGQTASESVASTTLTNGAGKTNGLQVFEDRTNLTGGAQQPTSLTMNDNGATFATSTGAPAKVTGVADGTTKYDAVNYGQLQALSSDMGNIAQRAYSGISQASAMASIPAPMAGHHYSVGMGSGFYAGQQAIAFGGKADVGEHIRLSAAMGTGMGSTSQMSANAGAGFSW